MAHRERTYPPQCKATMPPHKWVDKAELSEPDQMTTTKDYGLHTNWWKGAWHTEILNLHSPSQAEQQRSSDSASCNDRSQRFKFPQTLNAARGSLQVKSTLQMDKFKQFFQCSNPRNGLLFLLTFPMWSSDGQMCGAGGVGFFLPVHWESSPPCCAIQRTLPLLSPHSLVRANWSPACSTKTSKLLAKAFKSG